MSEPDLIGLAESLRASLPAEALSFDVGDEYAVDEYAVDEMTPLVVARPRTQQEVSAVLRASTEAGAAVLPRGAGTQMSLGMPPKRYDVALDLSSLEPVFEHEAADLTVTVGAGHSWAPMQASLAEHGQWVPLDPGQDERATVGGILATNASGPARIRYGTARDLVIGMTVALANGEIVKSGGRVVKNVAGYDMAKLHIGALGTLGVILQASFKVSPLAESRPYVAAQGELAAMSQLAEGVLATRLPLLGLALAKPAADDKWMLAARLSGGAAAVERAQREFGALAAGTEVEGESNWHLTFSSHDGAVRARASVSPTRTREVCEAFARAGSGVVSYPGVGMVFGVWGQAPGADSLLDLRRRAVAAGGAMVLEAAPVELKRAVGVWGESRGDFALMQRLKQQFDPTRTLNPGRFVGGI